ncbi:putative urea active transporter [Diaporthe ampelina]|uniref:Putative urea active transporter n=1 Tax=Diaporthe ampelina TaxID=1214573 RepID=A0A0G2I7Y0_9PEZI|nr:putative urea active transporter [Diaporthe ampelina]
MNSIFSRAAASGSIEPPLPQAVGYVVVVLIGFLIAFIMIFVTYLLKRTVGEDNRTTEMFMTANRRVEAHTLLEIVRIRYGNVAHIVWIALCLINNIIAVANMLLGASAAISALTGMPVVAAIFLLPASVVLYTFVGGIKATFLTDYFHTFIITIIICYFTIATFSVPEISSPGHLFDLVVKAGQAHPVAGNHDGSYLTMASKDAILFGIIHVLANFGLVIMDTGFFTKAFSAAPQAVVPGYIIGGIAYFAIPWCLGTLMSLSALGLEAIQSPRFPTYPDRMSTVEISNGLVLPYAAVAIAGKGGAAAVLLIIFMAVTSTISAQVIAVSSIITFDIYRQYLNRGATDRDVIRWSHIGVVIFGIFSAAFSTALYYGSVDLGWTLYMLGVLTCPGIFPTTFTILWRKQSKVAAIVSPLLGLATGLAVWLGSAHAFYGDISIASTGATLPCVYGTTASALSPALYSVVISLVRPANYDWAEFRKERLLFDNHNTTRGQNPRVPESHVEVTSSYTDDRANLKHWGVIASAWALATFFGHWVLWPLPMYAANYIFSRQFFAAWVVISIIWVWGTMFVAGFFPIIDGRKQLSLVFQGLRLGKDKAATPVEASSSREGTISEVKKVEDAADLKS